MNSVNKSQKLKLNMKKIRQFLINIRASLWFVPGVMITFSVILAFVLVEIDDVTNNEWLLNYPRFFGLGADGSRGMLTAISSSMLTVAALSFSLTLAALAQASAQYSPRIMRNFMRDRVNQFVLGYFVSVFAYCLVVLRTIRGADEIKFVPSFAVLVGLVSAIGGVIVLIYFIHHIAVSLQVTNIIEHISNETIEAIETLFPQEFAAAAHEEKREDVRQRWKEERWVEIPADEYGYIQYINTESMLEFAEENDLIIKMDRGIGQFVGRGAILASVTHHSEKSDVIFDDDFNVNVNSFFNINRFRTIEQDIGFGIRQIVDIALKALSPGINDTTTAVNCIDFLGVIIGELIRRNLPVDVRAKDGDVRVIVHTPAFQGYIETAFDQIRISGKGNQAIFERLIAVFGYIARLTNIEDRIAIIKGQLQLIEEYAMETLDTEYEKEKVANSLKKVRAYLDGKEKTPLNIKDKI